MPMLNRVLGHVADGPRRSLIRRLTKANPLLSNFNNLQCSVQLDNSLRTTISSDFRSIHPALILQVAGRAFDKDNTTSGRCAVPSAAS